MIHPHIYIGLTDDKKIMARLNRSVSNERAILSAVCITLKINEHNVLSMSRKRQHAEARCISIGLILQVNKSITLVQIGKLFNRDHSTVIYNRNLFNDLNNTDKAFTNKVNEVLKSV
jgi:chromosomal replication initiation ATPase DnaA